MLDEKRFIDPAFSCEVVLRNERKSLYEAAEDQFNRLKEIRDLGLIGHFEESGIHTRHNHLIGLLRLFEKLLVQPQGYGLPKEFLYSFWCRLCFGQTGHAAFSYDAEKAVLLACHVDSEFRQSFNDFLQPVVEKFAKDDNGDNNPEKLEEAQRWLEALISHNQWDRVYLWVAALKLIKNVKVQGILSSQLYDDEMPNKPGFIWDKALEILINPESEWDEPVRRLNRLDYVVRDLSFSGRLGVIVDVDHLVETVNEPSDYDWLIIIQLRKYLTEILYESAERQTQSVIFQRTLAKLLTREKFTISQLFGIDPGNCLNDEDVKKIVKKNVQGGELFNANIRGSWSTWMIKCALDEDIPPIETERVLSGQKKRQSSSLLYDAHSRKLICYKMRQKNYLGIAMCYRDESFRPDPFRLVSYSKRLIDRMYPRIDVGTIRKYIFESMMGCEVSHELGQCASVLADLDMEDCPDAIIIAQLIINKINAAMPKGYQDTKIVIRGHEIPMLPGPEDVMIYCLSKSMKNGELVNIKIEMAVLFAHLLNWHSLFFTKEMPNELENLMKKCQRKLADSIVENDKGRAKKLEVYAFIDSLLWNYEKIDYRISVPNLGIVREDGLRENEHDVATIEMRRDEMTIWIWGVTTEKNIEDKRNEDLRKIQKMRDRIGKRWGKKVRTGANYIHIDNDTICLDVDGRKSRRKIEGKDKMQLEFTKNN